VIDESPHGVLHIEAFCNGMAWIDVEVE